MAKWTIFDKHGVAKVSVVELELRDEWMAECYLTVTIKSATPIKFAIGDYIDYRGERYTIQYDPNVLKKASSGSYGEGFTYSNIKFVGLQDEIVRCDFNDIVLRDNQMHYTALPTFPFYCETVDDLLDRIQANLEELYPAQWTIIGLNTLRNKQRGTAVNRLKAFTDAYKTYIDQTEATKTEPYGKVGVAETVDKITCWDALKKVHDDFGLNFIIRGRVIIVGTAGVFTASKFRYGKGNGLYEIERIAESDQQIVTRLRAYGSEDNLPSRYYANTTEDMPNNMAVSKLMLPGFPTQSLADWVDAHKNAAGYEWLLDAVNEGFTFSKDAHRPYIDSPNIKEYGIRPSSIIFDGSEDKENIHPTIEGMVYDGKAIDEIYAADQIEDNGVLTENPNNFKITLPALGFDLGKVYEDGASIDIKNGMCGARSFKMVSAPTKNSDGRWVCTVERVHDDVLDLWFPYNDFQIKQGDKFVLTGIKLPDEYISSASVKLFKASIEALRKNHAPRYTYQPRIDEIWMQRQHDLAVSSDGTTSLHDTLKAGDIFSFADDDLAIDANIIIDVLTIKENGNNGVPTYEVTLRDEKQVGTMQKITNKIDSAFTNAVTTAVGGGLTSRQVQRLIERFGSEQFLSKLDDDTAAGFIKMLKGLQIGNLYVPGLLGEGGVLRMDADGKTYLEADKMYIRMKAYFDSVEVREYKHSVGNRVASPAGSKCVRVEWHGANNKVLEPTDANLKSVKKFRCFFRASDGEDTVRNNFVVGDQIYCHVTTVAGSSDNPESKGQNQKHYWRLCVGRNTEGTLTKDGEAWIDLSNNTTETISSKSYTGYQTGSDIPEAQDSMIQLGNVNDTTRQGAIIEFVSGNNAPAYQIYQGINSFSLNGKSMITMGYNSATGKAELKVHGNAYIGDPNGSAFLSYDSAKKELKIKAKVEILPNGSTIGNKTFAEYIKENQNNYDDSALQTLLANKYLGQLTGGSISQSIGDAQDAADKAQGAADDAQKAADDANTAAGKAQTSADNAQKSANTANQGAKDAASAAKKADDKAAAAQKKADEAYNKAATFNYLSQALSSSTEIDGGLILSTLIALRDKSGAIWSGINGAYNEDDETVEGGALGHGIAAWYGGRMIDHEATPTLADYAKILFRHDGSGYLAGGNISWNKLGKVTIKDIYTDVSGNEQKLGTMLNDLMRFNNVFHFRLDGNDVLGIVPQVSFDKLSIKGEAVATQKWANSTFAAVGRVSTLEGYFTSGVAKKAVQLNTARSLWGNSFNGTADLNGNIIMNSANGTFIQIGGIRIVYDSANNALKVVKSDGATAANFYATGGLTALGETPDGSAGVGDVTWDLLASDKDTRQVAHSHLTTALSTYATRSWVTENFNKFTLPAATTDAIGGVRIGYTTSGKNYAVLLDANNKMYVNVPWTDNNTTYSAATQSAAGLMSAADKKKLDGIAEGANKYTYTLPTASATVLGGIKIGYTNSGKNYAVVLDTNGKAYVNVPWTDNNTTYSVFSATVNGLVPMASDANKSTAETAVGNYYLCADGKFRQLPANAFKNDNTTYSFVNKGATLAWGATAIIATVGGVDIKVTMPGNPNTNTWKAASTTQEGYVPKLALATTNTIAAQATEYVLTYIAGKETTPVWRKLPANAFLNSTYSLAGLMGSAAKGGATQPIYWNGTAFANTTYTLGKSVPSDAVFTDTTYPKAIKNITRSGTTFTATCYDGTTFTFTQQDNNTWRGMQNNLTTSASNTSDSLSAYQGYLLANGSARDNTKLPLAGGTLTGLLTANAGVAIASSKTLKIGDIYIGYDSDNNAIEIYKLDGTTHVAANLYARGGLSSLGEIKDGSAGAGTGDVTWDLLESEADKRQIAHSHLTTALSTYAQKSEAIKSITRSGTTFTATRADGTTFTFTQQDSNTTYSASTGLSLSGTAFSINSTYQTYISNGNTAYGWGNHANAGYLKSLGDSFRSRGSVSDAYVDGTTFSKLENGWYLHHITNATVSLLHFQCEGSASGLDVKFAYSQDSSNPLQYRKTVDSKRFAGGWVTLIDSLNIGSQSVKYAESAGSVAWDNITGKPSLGGISSSGGTINGNLIIGGADIPEVADNLASYASTHAIKFYRNGFLIPYQMDNSNDGGMLRVRGTSESNAVLELATWDDEGDGETIQFNYYPTTSTVTPTYSVSVPKKSGVIALTSDLEGASSKLYALGDINFGVNYLQYKDHFATSASNDARAMSNPTADWYHHIVMNHGNSNGYYLDLAMCFHENYMYYRRVVAGYAHGWVRVIDSSNIGSQSVNYASSANIANYVYCSSHLNSWRLSIDYDEKAYFWLTGKYNGSEKPCAVSYATTAGNLSATSYINGSTSELPHLIWHIPNVNWGNLSMNTSGEFFFRSSNATNAGYANLYANLPDYLAKGGGTMSGAIKFRNDRTGIFNLGSGGTPSGYTTTSAGGNQQIGIISWDGASDEGGVLVGSDCCTIYNSADSEYILKVMDKDVGNDLSGGHTASNCLLAVGQGSNAGVYVKNLHSSGSVGSLSDARHKTIVRNICLDVNHIASMPSILYRWNDGRDDNSLHAGSIAQSWKKILPEVVLKDNDIEGTLSLDYGAAALVSAIITARKVVDHERRIRELEIENLELRQQLNKFIKG